MEKICIKNMCVYTVLKKMKPQTMFFLKKTFSRLCIQVVDDHAKFYYPTMFQG